MNIGFGNIVNSEKIIAVVMPDSAPAKRLIQNAKKDDRAIDATHGRKTRSVIIMENDSVIFSALLPETIYSRLEGLAFPAGAVSDSGGSGEEGTN